MDYTTLKDTASVDKASAALVANGFKAEYVADKAAALVRIKELIPAGVSVMNGTSTTLEQIGYIEYLKSGAHGWKNLHADILAETDPVKQAQLRRSSVTSDYYLGSAHAVTEDGDLIFASNSGSQLPHLVFSSPNLILIVGTQKIVPTEADGIQRIEQYVVGKEDERMMAAFNAHTQISKLVVLRKEPAYTKRNFLVIFVGEPLGF